MLIDQTMSQAVWNYDAKMGASSSKSTSPQAIASFSGRAAVTSECPWGENFSAGNTNTPWTAIENDELQRQSASNCPGVSHRTAPGEHGNIAMPEALDSLQRVRSHADHTTVLGDNYGVNDFVAAQDSQNEVLDAALLQEWFHTSQSFQTDLDIGLMSFQ